MPGTAENPELPQPPLYLEEVRAAAELFRESLRSPEAPIKLVWLLEHEYSLASLSFHALKNADAAIARVLVEAANLSGCVVYLVTLHVEESGSAEPHYDTHYRYRRRYGMREDDEVSDASFDVVEVTSLELDLDGWRDLSDASFDIGKIPLAEDELLPAGALDGAKPDEERLLEATGNEGVSYERAYHRAAFVICPKERIGDVYLQGGIRTFVPYLRDRALSMAEDGSDVAITRAKAWGRTAHWQSRTEVGDKTSSPAR